MNRNTIYSIIVLAILWVILRESFSVFTAAAGIVLGACCLFFCRRYLPFPKVENINPFILILYPLYMIVKIYAAGFGTIRLIIKDADADIIVVKTKLSNAFLRTILANSITIIPGSISLELKEDTITVLWLKKKTHNAQRVQITAESLKNKLERILLKAEG